MPSAVETHRGGSTSQRLGIAFLAGSPFTANPYPTPPHLMDPPQQRDRYGRIPSTMAKVLDAASRPKSRLSPKQQTENNTWHRLSPYQRWPIEKPDPTRRWGGGKKSTKLHNRRKTHRIKTHRRKTHRRKTHRRKTPSRRTHRRKTHRRKTP